MSASFAARRRRGPRRRPRWSWPSVASRRLSWVTARWIAARSWVGLVGSARSSSASGREGGSFSVRSISARSSSRRRCASNSRRPSRSSGGASPSSEPGPRALAGLQAERPADPLHVDADDSRALALAAEAGDGEPGEVAERVLVTVGDRLADELAELVEVEPVAVGARVRSLSPILRSSASASAARKKNRSKISSKTRLSSGDFAIVAASASRNSERLVQGIAPTASKASRISEVPTATPSLRNSSQKVRSFGPSPSGSPLGGPAPVSGAAIRSLRRPESSRPQAASRPARRRGRGRCGA